MGRFDKVDERKRTTRSRDKKHVIIYLSIDFKHCRKTSVKCVRQSAQFYSTNLQLIYSVCASEVLTTAR